MDEGSTLELIKHKVSLLGLLRTKEISEEIIKKFDLSEMIHVFSKHELYELCSLVQSKIEGKEIYIPREEWTSEKYQKIREILIPEKIRNKIEII